MKIVIKNPMKSPLTKQTIVAKIKSTGEKKNECEANEQRMRARYCVCVWMNEFQSRNKLGMTCLRHTFWPLIFLSMALSTPTRIIFTILTVKKNKINKYNKKSTHCAFASIYNMPTAYGKLKEATLLLLR